MNREIDFSKVKKILILNMIADTIGDSLFLTPLFRILKKKFPDKYIAVTATSTNRELFLNNPYLDEIIYIKDLAKIGQRDRSKISKAPIYAKILIELILKLRKKKFDLCFVGAPNFSPLQLVPFLSGIKYSVGYEYPGMYFSFLITKTGRYYDPYKPEGYNRHYLESVLDLLRFAEIQIDEKDKVVEKILTPEEVKKSEEILKRKGIKEREKIISFQAGAKWRSKCWPAKKFAELAKELIKRYNAKIILLGSPKEFDLNERINRLTNNELINLAGKVSLTEIAGILKKSSLLIGNDSGLMHLASAVGTKTIILYGSTNPEHSRPMGPGKSIAIFENDFCKPCITNKIDCPYNYKCMDVISVGKVLSTVDREFMEST